MSEQDNILVEDGDKSEGTFFTTPNNALWKTYKTIVPPSAWTVEGCYRCYLAPNSPVVPTRTIGKRVVEIRQCDIPISEVESCLRRQTT